jgi:hypothetical protein
MRSFGKLTWRRQPLNRRSIAPKGNRGLVAEALEPRQMLTTAASAAVVEPMAGDANLDGSFNEHDVVLMLQGGRYQTGDTAGWREGDFNGDGVFDQDDLVLALQSGYDGGPIAKPSAGDANLDGRFDQQDVLQMIAAEKYLTGQPATWGEGDFNGDGVFTQLDLMAALATGTYQPSFYAIVSSSFVDTAAEISTTTTAATSQFLPGDANQDHVFDQQDVVMILAGGKYLTQTSASWSEGDFDGNGVFDQVDLVMAQQTACYLQPSCGYGIGPGDANRDGVFDNLDIVQVLEAGKYETGRPANWAEGDWNHDGLFDSADIVAALQDGNYQQ